MEKEISMIWICVIFIGTIFIPRTIPAQERKITFEHISTRDGLSQSTITCILQDSKGFMWFGTQNGLNRYDGYSFTNFHNDPDDSTAMVGYFVTSIVEDNRGNIWIGTNVGLNRFDRSTNRFFYYPHNENIKSSRNGPGVGSILLDSKGNLWIGNSGCHLDLYDYESQTFIHHQIDQDLTSSQNTEISTIYEDAGGRLWIGTLDGDVLQFDKEKKLFLPLFYRGEKFSDEQIWDISGDKEGHVWVCTYGNGLYKLSFLKGEDPEIFQYTHDEKDRHSLSSNAVTSVFEDSRERLWVGTENEGLNLFDRESERFIHYKRDPLYKESLNNNSIRSIYEDKTGNFWIGTYAGGINMQPKYGGYFEHYESISGNTKSLSHNSVSTFHEDSRGNFWIGTDGGGLNLFDREKGSFTYFNSSNSNLSSDAILSVFEDSKKQLWVGTWGGGLNLFDRGKGAFLQFNQEHNNLASDNIFSILEDKRGVLWVASFFGGLSYLDPATNSFVNFLPQVDDLPDDHIRQIIEDSYGNIVVGANLGIYFFDPESQTFTSYSHDASDTQSLSDGTVLSILESADSTLWIGTANGLNKFNRDTRRFTSYYVKNGLPSNVIKGILEDDLGNLWLSTNKGVSKFNPKTESFKNFDISDGLQENEFYQCSYYKSPEGTFYFGGVNGFNAFHPEDVIDNPNIPSVVLTDFQIQNRSVRIGKNSPLQTHISEADTITLSYRHTFFSFEFTALGFISSQKNQYAWMLDGFDKEWIDGGNRHSASYTNIDPGEYTFMVKASNNDGIWNEQGRALKIIITPPFWQTLAFKILVIILVISTSFFIYYLRVRQVIRRSRILQELVDQRTKELHEKNELLLDQTDELTAQRDQLNESNAVKDKLFSIISHDIRSPFNSLNGFIELIRIRYDEYSDDKKKELIAIISGSAQNVYSLLDNLLSWSRSQRGTVKFNAQYTDVIDLIKSKIDLLSFQAIEKEIALELESNTREVGLMVDPDLFNVVLQNLIINAIKFTHPKGKIRVVCESEADHVIISVIDNGIGISEENLEKLFKPEIHFSTRGTKSETGTGLGMIICKDFIDMHQGQIGVRSEEGKGSTFFIKLPLHVDVEAAAM